MKGGLISHRDHSRAKIPVVLIACITRFSAIRCHFDATHCHRTKTAYKRPDKGVYLPSETINIESFQQFIISMWKENRCSGIYAGNDGISILIDVWIIHTDLLKDVLQGNSHSNIDPDKNGYEPIMNDCSAAA